MRPSEYRGAKGVNHQMPEVEKGGVCIVHAA